MAREYFYWLYGRNPEDGKGFLIYACPDREGESTARTRGFEMLGGMDFKIKRLPTRDIGSASAMIRGVKLDTGMGLRRAQQRLGHDKTVKRWRMGGR